MCIHKSCFPPKRAHLYGVLAGNHALRVSIRDCTALCHAQHTGGPPPTIQTATRPKRPGAAGKKIIIGGNTTWVHARAVLLQWPAWLSGCGGASNVVNTATAGPCGVAARGARAADAMAPHERMPPLGMLVTIATEHDATTITFGWWRTAGIHHNADTHTHTHRRAYRAHNWPPTATQPPIATNMTWYVTVNPVTSLGGAVTSIGW